MSYLAASPRVRLALARCVICLAGGLARRVFSFDFVPQFPESDCRPVKGPSFFGPPLGVGNQNISSLSGLKTLARAAWNAVYHP